ncbi:hypothetical protein KAR91_42950 [Candidatus Pacearchaeota archaeon]|nr:hypothetical protein [Candidatus Pacearchaeota archaeon]
MKKLFLLFLLCNFCFPHFAVASEPAEIMMLRPEKIRNQNLNILQGIERDPFNWSTRQANFFRKIAEDRQLEQDINISLNGIIWDNDNPLAVLNNRIVAEGDMVDGLLVVDIYPEEVLLQQKNILHTLKFDPLLMGIGGN